MPRWDQRLQRALGLGEGVLGEFDAGGADRRDSDRAAAPHRAAVGQALVRGRGFHRERDGPRRERLALAPRGPEVLMHDPGARVGAEAPEADGAGSRLEATRS